MNLIKCAVSHLPAGHPNACNDCDPCLMHDRPKQLDALYQDWERMYWETRALIEAAEKLLASDQPGHWDAFRHYDARKELLAALLKAKGGE